MNRQSCVSTAFGECDVWKQPRSQSSVFVWLFSDERRSVQPSHQVHRGLHRPPQHLHRYGVLSPRKPAGRVSCCCQHTQLFCLIPSARVHLLTVESSAGRFNKLQHESSVTSTLARRSIKVQYARIHTEGRRGGDFRFFNKVTFLWKTQNIIPNLFFSDGKLY